VTRSPNITESPDVFRADKLSAWLANASWPRLPRPGERPPATVSPPPAADSLRTPAKPTRKPRRTSISKMIKQAEKATGKPVTSITLPDGTKLDFSKPDSAEPEKNPWPLDEFRKKETKQ